MGKAESFRLAWRLKSASIDAKGEDKLKGALIGSTCESEDAMKFLMGSH